MSATTQVPARQRSRAGGAGRLGLGIWPYIFISPFFLLFAVFGLFPYLYAFYLSFLDWDGISPQTWVGLANYQELLDDSLWWKALGNTIWLMVATLIPQLGLALFLAFILNSGLVRFKDAYRTAFFTPIIASSIAITLVFASLFGQNYGLLNQLLRVVGIAPIDWLGSAAWIKPAIAIVVVWRYFGWNTIIYLAGLQSIPTDLYEAARVDGASWRDILFRITIPLLRPVITFTVILSIIGSLQLYEEPVMLTGGPSGGDRAGAPGGTDGAGLTVMVYLYNVAFSYVRFGYAATLSVALFVVIICFSVLYNRFLGRNLTD